MRALGASVGPQAAHALLAAQVTLFAEVQAYGDTFLVGAIVTAIGIPAASPLPAKRSPS
ncbi:MAG TPA: hypothetical protein VMA36_18060 [Candidatus Limnocylindria bacterium]|nr:hypothetical protein [Candidatus Limnocylindria bacterium]